MRHKLVNNRYRWTPDNNEPDDGTITNTKMATDAIHNVNLADNAVNTAELADNAVTTAKITDANVSTAKLADDAVTNAKVATDAIGLAELSATGTASSSTYLRGDNTWATVSGGGGGGGLFVSYARLSDVKAYGAHGGTSPDDDTVTRTLNTEDFDPDNIVTLSNDVFTLDTAGTYFIKFKTTAAKVDYTAAYLQKSTDSGSTWTIVQQSVGHRFSQDSGVYSSINIIGDCRETITQSTQYRLRHYTQRDTADIGLGLASGRSALNSIYSVVHIYKEA